MKTTGSLTPRTYRLPLPLRMILPAAILAAAARAQTVVAPAPEVSNVPPAVDQAQSSGARSIAPLQAAEPQPGGFPMGMFSLRPHLLYRFVYGDGIPSAPGQERTTALHQISPGLLIDVGDRWTIDYTPTWNFYSNRSFQDTVDHAFRVAGGAGVANWTFGLGESFIHSTQPLIEPGRPTRQESSSTNLSALGSITRQVAVEFTAAQDLRYVSQAPNSYQWSTLEWLHYQSTPRLDTAVGLGYGYLEMTHSPTATYWQYLGRVDWRATDKVHAQLMAGGESREFRNSSAGALNTPIFNGSIVYQPADSIQLGLGASKQVSPSYFTGQVTKTTGWNATLTQRMLEHVYLTTTYMQGKTSYIATEGGVTAGRDDSMYAVNVRLSTRIAQRGSIAAFFQRTHNRSNLSGFGLSSNQFGLELGYRF